MRQAVAATTAGIVVFVDGDLASLEPSHIHTLSEPLLNDPCAMLVKPAYRRALHGRAGEGGRVTELVARPLLQLLWPELAHLSQPLAGECAIRRAALNGIDLADGYAVELRCSWTCTPDSGPRPSSKWTSASGSTGTVRSASSRHRHVTSSPPHWSGRTSLDSRRTLEEPFRWGDRTPVDQMSPSQRRWGCQRRVGG